MTTKTDDMTDRGNYSLSPWGVSERYSNDCCYRVTFRGVEGTFDLGVSPSKAEAERVIADHIAAAREFTKEQECRRQREVEERVEAARQQIPKKFRGLTLDDLSEAARSFVATFKDQPPSGPIVHGDADASKVKVACAILVELARQGLTVRYITINDALNARMSDLTAPDFLLLHWPGRVEAKIAAAVFEVLQARGETKTTMVIVDQASRGQVQKLLQAERDQRIAAEAEAKRRAESDAEVARIMAGPPPPTRWR
jgi:hypothetical protein